MKKRFIVSTWTFLPDIGGVASNKFTLCNALIKAGYDVTVVTSTPGPELNLGYKVYRQPNPLLLYWLYLRADIIYYSNQSIKLGWPTIFLNKTFGLCHHSASATEDFPKGFGGFLKKLVANAITQKSVHFPNSYFTQMSAREVLEGHTSVVAYPIASKTEVEAENLNEYKSRKDIFFAGRLVAEKGVGFLIDNWKEIQKTLGVEKLNIAGDGPEHQQLIDKVGKLNLKGINFMGAQPLNAVVNYMKQSAYVMVPSMWDEPFGNVGVEGVASGAIVISSDKGGLPEAVGDVGVLFGFEPDSLKHSLIKAKKLRDHVSSSQNALDDYVEQANRHLAQFSGEHVVNVIMSHLD